MFLKKGGLGFSVAELEPPGAAAPSKKLGSGSATQVAVLAMTQTHAKS